METHPLCLGHNQRYHLTCLNVPYDFEVPDETDVNSRIGLVKGVGGEDVGKVTDTGKWRREKILNLRARNERMTCRERAIKAINREEPDRIPIDVWVSQHIREGMMEYWGFEDWEDCLQFLGADFRYWRGSSYASQEPGTPGGVEIEDHWGVRRRAVKFGDGTAWGGSYKEVAFSPLASAEGIEDVHNHDHWPSADQWDYDKVPDEIDAIRQKAGDVFIWNGGDRVDRTAQLKPMMYLRGIQETFFDLALRPELVEAIVGHIYDYFVDYNGRTFEASRGLIDGFFCGDDMGAQNGPLISVDMYRQYFKDRFSDYVALAHEYRLPVMYHTCGSVKALIPEFIDSKLDVLQSLQPQAHNMDLCVLKKQFGRVLAFQGGADIQGVLPHGSPADVRRMVRRLAECGAPGGGYIFGTAHNIQADAPIENVVALFEAYHEFGAY